MVKFFLCYAWLGIGFLVAFKIFFSDERVFEGFPIPLVTMLVWMLGELEYADKLFPEDVKLNLLKKVVELNGTNEKHYTGIEESEDGYLQFAGNFFFKTRKVTFNYDWYFNLFLQELPTFSLLPTSFCSPSSS